MVLHFTEYKQWLLHNPAAYCKLKIPWQQQRFGRATGSVQNSEFDCCVFIHFIHFVILGWSLSVDWNYSQLKSDINHTIKPCICCLYHFFPAMVQFIIVFERLFSKICAFFLISTWPEFKETVQQLKQSQSQKWKPLTRQQYVKQIYYRIYHATCNDVISFYTYDNNYI